jgi:hypothetical protein
MGIPKSGAEQLNAPLHALIKPRFLPAIDGESAAYRVRLREDGGDDHETYGLPLNEPLTPADNIATLLSHAVFERRTFACRLGTVDRWCPIEDQAR